MSVLHLVEEEVYSALVTPMKGNSPAYIRANKDIQNSLRQAIQLDTNIVQAAYIGKNKITYDYGFLQAAYLEDTLQEVEQRAQEMQAQGEFTYVGPVRLEKELRNYSKDIIPVIRFLKGKDVVSQIGIMYLAVNFSPIQEVIKTSSLLNSNVILFDQDNTAFYATNHKLYENQNLLQFLQNSSAEVGAGVPSKIQKFQHNGNTYWAYTVYNDSSGWKVAYYYDDTILTDMYHENAKSFFQLFLFFCLLDLFFSFGLSRMLGISISRVCREIEKCESGILTCIPKSQGLASREIQQIIDSYNLLNDRLRTSIEQKFTVQLNEKKLKLLMLRTQINPHFLYNTLNLISSLANIHDIPEIKTISDSMSDLLRYNLKSGSTVRLRDEIEQIQNYISIQQIRFPNRFQFSCSVSSSLAETKIPTFILQPIVENAISHGLYKRKDGGKIFLHAYCSQHDLHLSVTDNGVGISEERLEEIRRRLLSVESEEYRETIGICNVHQRIQASCGSRYGLSIESTVGAGTIVDIKLPLQ